MQIKLQYVVNHIKELLLPKKTKNKILVLSIDYTIANYDEDSEFNCYIDLFFYNPNNYVKIGYRIRTTDENRTIHGGIKYLSDHDSCWRNSLADIRVQLQKLVEQQGLDYRCDHTEINFSNFDKTIVFDGSLEHDKINKIFTIIK